MTVDEFDNEQLGKQHDSDAARECDATQPWQSAQSRSQTQNQTQRGNDSDSSFADVLDDSDLDCTQDAPDTTLQTQATQLAQATQASGLMYSAVQSQGETIDGPVPVALDVIMCPICSEEFAQVCTFYMYVGRVCTTADKQQCCQLP